MATITLTLSAAGHEQGASNRADIEKTIVANERAIITAITNNDTKTFHSHIVPDSYFMGDDGPTKQSGFDKVMAQMKSDCKISKSDISGSTFYWVNENVVIHMFKPVVDGKCQGQPLPQVWASTVWSKNGGKWLAAYHQETPVTPPAPATKR